MGCFRSLYVLTLTTRAIHHSRCFYGSDAGIGKRSGAAVAGWVGDVGTNHIVGGSAKMSANPSQGIANFFGGKSKLEREASVGFLTSPTKPRGGTNSWTHNDQDPIGVRQSLILLEEVDILYQTDASFWPSVVNLIKNSRRPVIMTCNG